MAYLGIKAVLERFQRSGSSTFTVGDAAKAMHKSAAYASLVLSTNKKVKRLVKGLYYVRGTSPYELASNVVYPAYVSLSAALQYYDLIDQNIIKYSVITTKRHKPVKFEGGEIEFITVDRTRLFGYTFRNNSYIALPEKMFTDCLYFGRPAFSQVEVSFASALENQQLDITKLKDYAVRMNRKSLINKLGFLLELNNIKADDMLGHTYRAGYVRVGKSADGVNKKWRVLYDRRK